MHTHYFSAARRKIPFILVIIIMAVAMLGITPQPAHAAGNIIVNTLTDVPAAGFCTLSEAIGNANAGADTSGGHCDPGSTTNSITFTLSGPITEAATLTISSSVVMTASAVTISGNGTGSVIVVNSTGDLTLDGVDIINGNAAGPGGGIYNDQGKLTVKNSAFFNNKAGGPGGAISSNSTTQTVILNTTFTNNQSSDNGGTIFNAGTDMEITGGAIANSTAVNGGAIYNQGDLTITGTFISSGTASTNGGGIYNLNHPLTLTNVALTGDKATSGSGGGIYNDGGTLSVTGSTFQSNKGQNGGALYTTSVGGTATISTSTFSANIASSSGGGIYNAGNTVTLTADTFASNTSSAIGGGAIYSTGTTDVAASLFHKGATGSNCNGALTDSGYSVSDDASCNLTGLQSLKSAVVGLGPLDANDSNTLTETQLPTWRNDGIALIPNGTTITNNSVTFNCDGIQTDQNGITRPRTTGAPCTSGAVEPDLVEYTCPTPGNIGTTDDLNACLLETDYIPGTYVYTLGADLTLTAQPPMIESNVTLHGANHFIDGNHLYGIFYILSSASPVNLTLDNITVKNAKSDFGAGILNFGGTLTVTNSTLSGNQATEGGGGLYNVGGTSTFTNTTFSSNTSDLGGAILNGPGTVTIHGGTFSTNSAIESGGAIYNSDGLTIDGATFSHNTANGTNLDGGGGIENDSGTIAITTSTFDSNQAQFGAGLDNLDGTATVTGSTFSNNTAELEGGGFDNVGTAVLTNNTFASNKVTDSQGRGGGAANDCDCTSTVMTGNTFYQNYAAFGGNYSNNGTLAMAGNIFARVNNSTNIFDTGAGPLVDNGYNLADDTSLPATGLGSHNSVPLYLSPPALNNGGKTKTDRPGPNSAALNAIPNGTTINNSGVTLACDGSTTDQNGSPRPLQAGLNCTAGSTEVLAKQHLVVESPVGTVIANGSILDMGSTPLGTSVIKTITLRNTGVATLTIFNSTPIVTGGFTATPLGITAIPFNTSTTFDLTCPATTPGNPVTGTVTINNDDPAASPFTFTVKCEVLAPEIALTDPDMTPITNHGTYSLGTTVVSPTPLTKTITVTNTGTAPLLLTNPLTVSAGFHATDFTSTSLAAGDSATFDLSCDATAPNAQATGTVSFTDNDADENPFTFTVNCQVLSAAFDAPDTLIATANSQTEIGLTWNSNTLDATNFRIERSLGGGAGWTEVGTTPASTPSFTDSLLDCNTLYYYRVRAYRTADGVFSNYSNIDSATTQPCSIVDAPTLTAPANGSQTKNNIPTFTWSAVTSADNYQIQIDDNSDFSSPVQTSTTATLSYNATQLIDGTTYYWRVRALETSNTISGPWSAVWSAQIDRSRLATPTLSAPANNGIVTLVTPKFIWAAVSGATQYRLQVDDDSAFGSPVFTRTLGKITSYTALAADNLQYGTTYYWRVQAGDAQNVWSNWSSIWTFPLTIMKTPINGAFSTTQKPTFTWTAVAKATNYELQVSPDTSFSTLEASFSGNKTSFAVPNVLNYGPHFWRVRVTSPAGTSPWMAPWVLTVTTTLPVAPVLNLPATNFVIFSNTPTFSWFDTTTANGGLFSYQIQIAPTSNFFGPLQDVKLATGLKTYTALTPLNNGVYYWRVRTINNVDTTGPWSAVRKLTVNIAAPKPTAPKDWTATNTLLPKFTWAAVSGAKYYTWQLYSDNACTTPVGSPVQNLTTPTYTIPAAAPLVDGTSYCWTVQAIDALGNTDPINSTSVAFHFTANSSTNHITTTVLPILSSPAANATVSTTTPNFIWVMVPTPYTFEIQIDTSATFPNPKQDNVGPQGQTNYPATTLSAGVYYWRVRAINAQGVAGPFTPAWKFTVKTAAPTAPVQVAPAQNANVMTLRPSLSWKAVPGATSYLVQLSDQSNLSSPIVNKTLTSPAVSYPLAANEALKYGKIYYWQVTAFDAANHSTPSAIYQFTTTVHLAPKDGSATTTVRPTFTWQAVSGANYTLEVFDDALLTHRVETYTGPKSQYPIPLGHTALIAGTTYYWHVVINNLPGGPYTTLPWSFKVTVNIPATPVLLTPANNGLTNDSTPTFTWKAATNALKYEIQIGDSTTFTNVLQDFTSNGALQYTAGLLNDGKYYWRVRSLNVNDAPGAWSAAWAINIDATAPAAPAVVGPASGTHTTNPSLTLRWLASTGATKYEIRFDTANPPATPPISVGNVVSYVVSWPHPQLPTPYYWQVRAIDAAGNISDWSGVHSLTLEAGLSSASIKPKPSATVEPTFAPPTNTPDAPTAVTVEAESENVVRAGVWTEQSTDNASGGKYLYSSGQAGDALTLGFSGTQLDIVFVKHPAFGSFAIEVDGTLRQTVDAHDEQTTFRAEVSITDLTPGTHVLRIYAVQGTVALDAFQVEALADLPATTVAPTATPSATPTDQATAEATTQATEPTAVPTEAATATPVTPTPVQLVTVEAESDTVVRNGQWTAQSSDSASGGSYVFSSGQPGDALELGFSGTQATIIYVGHPTFGSFNIEVDDVVKQTVVATTAQASFGTQVTVIDLASGTHVLRVYAVQGTVAIDAFQVEATAALPATAAPTAAPTDAATVASTQTVEPTTQETAAPSDTPTEAPTQTVESTIQETDTPTVTVIPTEVPTDPPTATPTEIPPTATDTPSPTQTPTPTDPPTATSTDTPLPATPAQ